MTSPPKPDVPVRLTVIIIVTVLLSVCVIVGCDREEITPTTPPPPPAPSASADGADRSTTAPVTTDAPTTSPDDDDAATQPAAAQILINGQLYPFPPAKLALREKGGQVYALLYSDDPPEALDESYTGHSFYFEMTLDVPAPDQLALAQWLYKAPTSERADTHNGVFLNGRRWHLQPFDVMVEFDGSTTPVNVWLAGQFMMYETDADPTAPGQLIPVQGEMRAELKRVGK